MPGKCHEATDLAHSLCLHRPRLGPGRKHAVVTDVVGTVSVVHRSRSQRASARACVPAQHCNLLLACRHSPCRRTQGRRRETRHRVIVAKQILHLASVVHAHTAALAHGCRHGRTATIRLSCPHRDPAASKRSTRAQQSCGRPHTFGCLQQRHTTARGHVGSILVARNEHVATSK